MNTQLLIPLLVTMMVAVVGWFVVHQLNAARDRANKRREKLTEFLIEAYRRLERYPGRELSPSNAGDFESAIADIQLFGPASLVLLAQSVAEDIPKLNGANPDQLLIELRKALRKELRLEKVADRIVYLRVTERKVPRG
jgi:hypothetical protein